MFIFMNILALFIIINIISFVFFIAVFVKIKKHASMYKLPKRLALNCNCWFFRRRIILMVYMTVLLVFMTLTLLFMIL